MWEFCKGAVCFPGDPQELGWHLGIVRDVLAVDRILKMGPKIL